MIPPFGESGFLPPGIHPATLTEIEGALDRNPSFGACRWSRCDGWWSWPSGLVSSGSY